MSRRPRTAALALGVAGVVALTAGGGAVANTLITGKQIKDGTVTGADLKNGTVRSVDVGDGSLTGTDIKNGSITSTDVAGGYYTKAQVDAKFWTSGAINLPGYAFSGANVTPLEGGCVAVSSGTAFASVQIPTGTTITGFTASVIDNNIAQFVTVRLFRGSNLLAEASTPANNFIMDLQPVSATLVNPETVAGQEAVYLSYAQSAPGDLFLRICGVSLSYQAAP